MTKSPSNEGLYRSLRRAVAVTSRRVLEQPDPMAVIRAGSTVLYRYGADLDDLQEGATPVFVMQAQRLATARGFRYVPRLLPIDQKLLSAAYGGAI